MAPQRGAVADGHEADLRVGLDGEIPFEHEVEGPIGARPPIAVADEEGTAGEEGEPGGEDGQERAGLPPPAQARSSSSRWMSPVTSATP